MAKYRQIYTEFWSDSFVLELPPEEKYFYLYLLTNTKSTQCGVYELSPRLISMEIGYDIVLVKQLLKKFCEYKKILYNESTKEIMVLNWIKYNLPNNINAVIGINKELQRVKNKEFLEILFEKCLVLKLNVDKIFKDIIPANSYVENVNRVDVYDMHDYDYELNSMNFKNVEEPNGTIIVTDNVNKKSDSFINRPLDSPLVGPTKPHPSNRIRSKEQEVINKEEVVIFKENVMIKEKLMDNEKVITKFEEATSAEDLKTIIKIFEENIHSITPLVYEKILNFTKHVSGNVIIMAITEAVNYNAKTIKYIATVLNSWISIGIKTAEQLKVYQNKWTGKTNNINNINNGSAARKVKPNSFCDYEQRTYDFDLLEKQLLGIG